MCSAKDAKQLQWLPREGDQALGWEGEKKKKKDARETTTSNHHPGRTLGPLLVWLIPYIDTDTVNEGLFPTAARASLTSLCPAFPALELLRA